MFIQFEKFGSILKVSGRCLGKGGFAKVYYSTEYRIDEILPKKRRAVAIKLVPRRRIQRDEQKARILNEIQIHKKLDHPNIVKMHSSLIDDLKVWKGHFRRIFYIFEEKAFKR